VVVFIATSGFTGFATSGISSHNREWIVRIVFGGRHRQADNQRGFIVKGARGQH